MLVGVLAICGVPGFSGFFSKDAVIYGALATGHPWLYAAGVVTAGITAYYMFRLLFVTFFGAYRGGVDPSALGIAPVAHDAASSAGHHPEEEEPHHHAPSWLMVAPVALLMIGSVFVGWLDVGGEASPWRSFFRGFPGFEGVATTGAMPELASTMLVLAVVAVGFTIAYARYLAPAALRDAIPRLRQEAQRTPALLVHAYYFDAFYAAVFVRGARSLGSAFGRVVDPHGIDAGVREVAISAQWLGHLLRSFQTGLVRAYALSIVLGVAGIVAYYAVAFGVSR